MNNELIGELLQGLTDDVASVKKSLALQPQPPDYRPVLEKLATTVLALRDANAKSQAISVAAAPAVDLKALEQQVRRAVAEEVRIYHPDRPISQAIRYGTIAFVGVLLLLCWSLFSWLGAATARDRYVRSDWFWRYTQQTNGPYAAHVAASWRQDSVGLQQRIEQAEADELLRLQARRKRQEAAALEKQAAQRRKP